MAFGADNYDVANKVKLVKGSFGKGGNASVAAGVMFLSNAGLELGISQLFGGKH